MAAPLALPPRVVLNPLPSLLVYDHCPFCVRVRHLLGLKNVKYNLVWLASDDVETPTALVGRKIVPIFQPNGVGGPAQDESLDICAAIDSDERYGPPGLLKPASGRTDISQWIEDLDMTMRRLTRIRFARAPLPEVVFSDARESFISKYPLENPDGCEANMVNSAEYIAKIQDRIEELADMIYSPYYCSPGGMSLDDIILFPRLRNMTIMKGLKLPPKIQDYVEYHAKVADVPLYYYCAM
ncbi:Glutaredoxin 2 [Gracilaria domingensis]|nr:Glutaredoxin 2 [Gracilaria domingensis]